MNGTAWTLAGKTALVTGGSKGIGRAIVAEFLQLGASVTAVARNTVELAALRQDFAGAPLQTFAADLSTQTGIDTLVQSLTRVDILVNNVGMNIRKKALDYNAEMFERIVRTNLFSAFELARKCHPLLAAAHGCIVNISSASGLVHVRSGVVYGMTKAAIVQMTRNLAVEWAADGIRVNAIAPWYVQTPLTESILSDPDFMQQIIARSPLKRIATPEEIAAAVAFLSMGKASFITGQCLSVDGGFTINGF
jgi:tropinone reductase I